MKTVVIGDIHGRNVWKKIIFKEDPDRVIFIGDYFDSHEEFTAEQEMNNFLDIIEYKKTSKDVIMLIGNHDFHYFEREFPYTGFQAGAATSINWILKDNSRFMQAAYAMDDILFTHAGVSETWLNDVIQDVADLKKLLPLDKSQKIADFVNQVWLHKPIFFQFNGWEKHGDNATQTPIWIRPLSLTKDTHSLRKNVIQVVGHTRQSELWMDDVSTLKGRYYFIDTLGISGEYLIIEDGEFKKGKI